MRIRVDKFCSLATSRDWQTWLFKYNEELYREFIARLRLTRGCGDNRELMIQTLDMVHQAGGTTVLLDFLRANYPYIIVGDNQQKPATEWDRLFHSGILTYPKRKILFGTADQLPLLVEQFVSDKIKYESLIVSDRAYVEYLDSGEEHLFAQIPTKNWLIREKKHG